MWLSRVVHHSGILWKCCSFATICWKIILGANLYVDFVFFFPLLGLSKRTTTEGLREAFSKFGEVVHGMLHSVNFLEISLVCLGVCWFCLLLYLQQKLLQTVFLVFLKDMVLFVMPQQRKRGPEYRAWTPRWVSISILSPLANQHIDSCCSNAVPINVSVTHIWDEDFD